MCSGIRIERKLGETADVGESLLQVVVELESSLRCGLVLKGMQSGELRHGCDLLVDFRIVFHCAASQRIISGIHTEILVGEVGEMTHNVKFRNLGKSGSLFAQKTLGYILHAVGAEIVFG